jgi:hypothetical protein
LKASERAREKERCPTDQPVKGKAKTWTWISRKAKKWAGSRAKERVIASPKALPARLA